MSAFRFPLDRPHQRHECEPREKPIFKIGKRQDQQPRREQSKSRILPRGQYPFGKVESHYQLSYQLPLFFAFFLFASFATLRENECRFHAKPQRTQRKTRITICQSERYSVNMRQILSLGNDAFCHKTNLALTDAVTLTCSRTARCATLHENTSN